MGIGAGVLRPSPVAAGGDGVAVLPRSAWAGADRTPGLIADEPEVRFLLVHHTVTVNSYAPDQVVGLLRQIHDFHRRKGWPDIAYNFIVDRFGRAWETRAGSLDRAVVGDATDGNQGWDQKCAFLGDHRTEPPTPEAESTMVRLLAFLADRSGIDTTPGATATFESRGSNLHPAGTVVTTPTITGHRTMSQTACPGDAAFALVRDRFPAVVTASRAPAPPPATRTPTSQSAPTPAAPGTAPPAPPTSAAVAAPVPDTSAPPSPATEVVAGGAADPPGRAPVATDPLEWPLVGAAGGAVALVLGGVLVIRSRQIRR